MKKRGPAEATSAAGRVRLLLSHPRPEVVEPPQLVLCAPARLEGTGQIGDQVKAHRGGGAVAARPADGTVAVPVERHPWHAASPRAGQMTAKLRCRSR